MRKILFDLWGLFMQVQSEEQKVALEEYVEIDKFGVTAEQFRAKYRELREPLDANKWGFPEYLEVMGTDLGIQFPDIDGFTRADYETWNRPDTEMIAWLEELTAGGLEVGLLSNVPMATLNMLWEEQPWLTKFRPRIFSAVIGAAKPRKEAFAIAADLLESEPGEILFFDDTLENVQAARQAGFNAHHFVGIDDAKPVLEAFLADGTLPEGDAGVPVTSDDTARDN
ncbi:HAD family hydrolase [Arcanobacterium canis]|uniref:HAD-IA family hydrolase n=1 Tax=Arcanobacterium canis TaxID=999183 RepID=A0ABY8G0N0_9ACTO|nr:HAD-IA family hydrolase [Arcanobacterium canis]WFM83338.1 HAD-IA family hydrolase [Arcanobacterium canis]